MSADYILNNKLTLKKVKYPLTCVACHDPHMNKYEHQLRKPERELCISCHTIGSTGGHGQKEMVEATGGYGGVPPARGHNTAIEKGDCTICHYHTREYKSDAEPAITGHEFKAYVERCYGCHQNARERWDQTQPAIKGAMASLKAKLDAIDESKLGPAQKTLYDEAKFNYTFLEKDGSYGIHNKPYAESIIKAAEQRLNQLK